MGCVAGCEPHVRMIDVHRFIARIIVATTSIIDMIIIARRLHVLKMNLLIVARHLIIE